MKKVSIILSFMAMVCFVNAQQAATASTVKQATPVVKVDSKPSTINAPAATETKACSGKTAAAACSGHTEKAACTKGAAAPACCQKNGGAAGCSHAAAESHDDKKAK